MPGWVMVRLSGCAAFGAVMDEAREFAGVVVARCVADQPHHVLPGGFVRREHRLGVAAQRVDAIPHRNRPAVVKLFGKMRENPAMHRIVEVVGLDFLQRLRHARRIDQDQPQQQGFHLDVRERRATFVGNRWLAGERHAFIKRGVHGGGVAHDCAAFCCRLAWRCRRAIASCGR